MKRTKYLLTAILLVSTFLAASRVKAQSVNFSGKWQIDTTRTSFKMPDGSPIPRFVISQAVAVTQTPAGVMIDRTNLTNDLQEKHYLQQMTFDGKASQTVSVSGNNETDVLAWSPDKSGLIVSITSTSPDNQPVAKITETWILADGGKTLLIDKQVEQTGGFKYEIKGYYQKQ